MWGFVVGLAIGMMVATLVYSRMRKTCVVCGNKHPPRPPDMTALEYVQFYCKRPVYKPRLGWISFFRKRRTEESDG